MRYLYEPGELEKQYGGERRRRSTDPIWWVDVHIKEYQPTLYYFLDGGPKRSFVFEELQPIQDS